MPLFCCEVILNYYERHLGDYAKDTAHLSMMEHGAYNLLLDRYYATEQGIPDSNVFRIARARTKEEKNAVKTVLSEFFELIEGVWINHRSEEEISKAFRPNTATDEAIAQYVSGGLVQWPTSWLRRGLSQSPLSSMCRATLV